MPEYKTQLAHSPDNCWITSAAVSTPNYSTYLRCQESSGGDKEGKCKCKTSHDRIWQWADISPLSLWCLLLHSLNRFNLPLNSSPFQITQLWSLSCCKFPGLRQIHYSFHTPIRVSSAACNALHLSPCQLTLLFALLSGRTVLLGSFLKM